MSPLCVSLTSIFPATPGCESTFRSKVSLQFRGGEFNGKSDNPFEANRRTVFGTSEKFKNQGAPESRFVVLKEEWLLEMCPKQSLSVIRYCSHLSILVRSFVPALFGGFSSFWWLVGLDKPHHGPLSKVSTFRN